VLADVRCRPGIRVSTTGDRAWVWWGAECDFLEEILVRRIAPLAGVELFSERGGCWYRLGAHLPAFGLHVGDDAQRVSLERVLVPAPFQPEPPSGPLPEAMRVSLVRAERSLVRPPSALRCALRTLAEWAERATTKQIGCSQAAWTGGSDA